MIWTADAINQETVKQSIGLARSNRNNTGAKQNNEYETLLQWKVRNSKWRRGMDWGRIFSDLWCADSRLYASIPPALTASLLLPADGGGGGVIWWVKTWRRALGVQVCTRFRALQLGLFLTFPWAIEHLSSVWQNYCQYNPQTLSLHILDDASW